MSVGDLAIASKPGNPLESLQSNIPIEAGEQFSVGKQSLHGSHASRGLQ